MRPAKRVRFVGRSADALVEHCGDLVQVLLAPRVYALRGDARHRRVQAWAHGGLSARLQAGRLQTCLLQARLLQTWPLRQRDATGCREAGAAGVTAGTTRRHRHLHLTLRRALLDPHAAQRRRVPRVLRVPRLEQRLLEEKEAAAEEEEAEEAAAEEGREGKWGGVEVAWVGKQQTCSSWMAARIACSKGVETRKHSLARRPPPPDACACACGVRARQPRSSSSVLSGREARYSLPPYL